MCGRYALTCSAPRLARLLGLLEPPPIEPRYNVAPGQEVPVVRAVAGGGRRLDRLRWGLVPSWSKDPRSGYRMINARAETLAQRPAFRGPFRQRRCLLPADGFYEWRTLEGRRQPYLIGLPEREPFALAGLWEAWRDPTGTVLESCTIITTEASPLLAEIHDRMPVILDPSNYAAWLGDAETPPETLSALLRPYPGELLAYPVNSRVNSPRYDEPACIEPIGPLVE